jgi:hypothetical protein
MKSKGLDFPDNFMDIFGFHRANEVEQVNRQKELELILMLCCRLKSSRTWWSI